VAQGILAETGPAQPGGAGAAAAPQAQAEALPPLVVRPALAAAVREVIAAEVAYQAAHEAWWTFHDGGKAIADRDAERDAWCAMTDAQEAVHAAIAELEREVVGGADCTAQP
jgi:hypothetical protein